MVDANSGIKIETNAIILDAKDIYASQLKSGDISNVLSYLMPNPNTKNIVVDMAGVENMNLDSAPTIFGSWVNEATKKNISIAVTNANERVAKVVQRMFHSVVEIKTESTKDLLATLQSDQE